MSLKPSSPALFIITPNAATKIKKLISKRGKPTLGIRISTSARGCKGLSYTMEFSEERFEHDEVVTSQGVTIFIDPQALMFVIGTQMDHIDEQLQAGFVFKNPNEKGKCGCGKSFHV